MLTALAVSAFLAAEAPPPGPSPEVLATYREAVAKSGRTPEAQIKLALWCESRGLTSERLMHLASAAVADPANPVARALLGMVEDRGKWRSPDDLEVDHARAGALARYAALREKTAPTAEAQWKLSAWCDKNGLEAQAEAHAVAATKIEPDHAAARKRLGHKNVRGRWMTDGQVAAQAREARLQAQADRKWGPRLAKWRDDLRDKGRKAHAEAALARLDDPRAVPSIGRVFGTDDPADQGRMVQLLGQIDGGPASHLLATAALYGAGGEVRRAAAETLIRRDPRDFVEAVIGQIRDLLKYEIKPVGGPDSPGVLFVEGREYNVRRRYTPPDLPDVTRRLIAYREAGVFIGDPIGPGNVGQVNRRDRDATAALSQTLAESMARSERRIATDVAEARRATIAAQDQLEQDVATIERENSQARQINERALVILTTSTAADLGPDREAWKKWWTDRRGYSYVSPPPSRSRPTFDQEVPLNYLPAYARPRHSCFAAGTTVRTRDGMRAIESLRVGDEVLAQDVSGGRLGFEPVVAVYHNPPAPTVEVAMEGEAVVATGIHRFWTAGKGWTMARDLRPGDLVRTVSGTTRVTGISPRAVQPVYNLEVARCRSFFVGKLGALVHDNSLVEATPEPFDAPATSER